MPAIQASRMPMTKTWASVMGAGSDRGSVSRIATIEHGRRDCQMRHSPTRDRGMVVYTGASFQTEHSRCPSRAMPEPAMTQRSASRFQITPRGTGGARPGWVPVALVAGAWLLSLLLVGWLASRYASPDAGGLREKLRQSEQLVK